MASSTHLKGRLEILNQALNLVTEAALKWILLDDGYVDDVLVDEVDDGTADDMASHELSTDNYVGGFNGAGRRVPASRTLNRDDPNTRIEFDAADETWTALGPSTGGPIVGGVGTAVEKTTDADSWVVAFDELAANIQTNSGDFVYAPNAEGLIQF